MIKRVLIVSVVIFVIGSIIFWLVSGGLAAAGRVARNFTNPIALIFGNGTSTGMFIRLPWQPESPTRGPDISGYADEADAQNRASGDEAQQPPNVGMQVRSFGNPSPYVNAIRFTENNAAESDPSREYIGLEASGSNGGGIPISGWSLQSAVSGLRVYIPLGAPRFVLGIVNSVEPVVLGPGAGALITTSASPVGTSFRENICSGYLGELQIFIPEISNECPAPAEILPVTAENIRTYGNACLDYMNTLSPCHFPTSLPSNLSSACRSFITNTMSYNGCINMHGNRPSFALPSWRVYLGFRRELWDNTHDIIRLLDGEGQIVDVITY